MELAIYATKLYMVFKVYYIFQGEAGAQGERGSIGEKGLQVLSFDRDIPNLIFKLRPWLA